MMQCTAKSKRSGQQCERAAMIGRTVCYMHGGKSPAGVASATLKDGRYSKYLPARLAGRYQEAQADPQLLALREEISLVDSRLADLLKRVDTHEAGHWWQELGRIYAEFIAAQNKKDVGAMAQHLAEIGRIIQAGATDYAAWGEVYGVLEQRRKFVESERKRLVEMQMMISSERAMLLIAALVDVVKTHVTDRSILALISADVGKLVTVEAE